MSGEEFGLRWSELPRAALIGGQRLTNTLIICLSAARRDHSCSLVAYGCPALAYPGEEPERCLWNSGHDDDPHGHHGALFVREAGHGEHMQPLILPSFWRHGLPACSCSGSSSGDPQDLPPVARLEGCGEFSIYWRIALPLSKPALRLALFSFLGAAGTTWALILSG